MKTIVEKNNRKQTTVFLIWAVMFLSVLLAALSSKAQGIQAIEKEISFEGQTFKYIYVINPTDDDLLIMKDRQENYRVFAIKDSINIEIDYNQRLLQSIQDSVSAANSHRIATEDYFLFQYIKQEYKTLIE